MRVQLEQQPGPQGALLTIDNPTGEIKAMIGGYSFEDSKFNRATQAVRQVGSSFKVYVYADALEEARRLLTPSSICRLPPSAVGSPTLRATTMKNLKGPSPSAALWPAHATFPP